MAETTDGTAARNRELVAFGDALANALRARGMSQAELAKRLDATQSMISVWRNGQYECPHDTVFEIERILGLTPGGLSRCLGYLPPEAIDGPVVCSVQDAVLADDVLSTEAKHTLLALYRYLSESVMPEPVPAPRSVRRR